MFTRDFNPTLRARQDASFKLCVGIDPDLKDPRLPEEFRIGNTQNAYKALLRFGIRIVEETAPYAGAFKLNSAFYEAQGPEGMAALRDTFAYIRESVSNVVAIYDAKRGDIGNSNKMYASLAYDVLGADAITVAPYMGGLSLQPFWERKDKGVFVLCCTSNEGWREFQGLTTVDEQHLLYLEVARNFSRNWNQNYNIAFVAGATNPEQVASIRSIVGDDIPLLLPGVGEQGGDLEAAVKAAMGPRGEGVFLLNSSRGIIYADDPGAAARSLHERIFTLTQPEHA